MAKLTDNQKKKKRDGKCITPFCTKKNAPTKSFCHSCIENKKKIANPIRFTYETWLGNCRRRKKVNTVTLEEFISFVGDNDYIRKKGRGAKKFTISRIKECVDGCPKNWCNEHGYHFHNIESITLKENIMKYKYIKFFSDVPF